MKLPLPESAAQRSVLAMILTALACVILVVMLKTHGVLISLVLVAAAWLMLNSRPDASEHKALRSSIRLSADDIVDVMAEFDHFATSAEADAVADRTLHRPAIVDGDCNDPDIEAFRYQLSAAKRFLRRLDVRLHAENLETSELEGLLRVTDQRAEELHNAWMAARRAAFKLGPGYNDSPRKRQ